MIKSITIKNFRCFRSLEVKDCGRVNVIVGDNGTGKTALLEAIFLALGASPEVSLRYRQWRGLDGNFNGPNREIEAALWGDLFHNFDLSRPISIQLHGSGPEHRALTITHGASSLFVPATREQVRGFRPTRARSFSEAGITFDWKDAGGRHHEYSPKITARGIELPGSIEDLPDFFYFAASVPSSSMENANRFSILSRENRQDDFVKLFTAQYPEIEDLSIEVAGGAPAIYAKLKDIKEKVPVTSISGAINRFLAILLAIASRDHSVVLIDEADTGIYYKRHVAYWRAILAFADAYDSQLFMSTHNEEWLLALAEVGLEESERLELWRVERSPSGPVVQKFSGRQFLAGVKAGEVR
jgi:energy-coupling factor transporter ATP-binding protein EcfA2